MAEVPGPSGDEKTEIKEESESRPVKQDDIDKDPKLDFSGDKFDPVKALCTANLDIPIKNAPVFDNLGMYASKYKPPKIVDKTINNDDTFMDDTGHITRRFLPHQMPIRRVVVERNILTRMNEEDGPLAMLKEVVDKKIKVKVVTRGATKLRGYLIGFIEAFDRLWNLAMTDVDEVWFRKIKNKVLPGFDDLSVKDHQAREMKIRLSNVPKVKVEKVDKKIEKCERSIPKMIVRGEHIVIIIKLEESGCSEELKICTEYTKGDTQPSR